MYSVVAPIVLAVVAIVVVAVVVALVRRPMAALLTANSYLAPAAKFYGRTFVVVILLSALAGLAGMHNSFPDPEKAKAAMEWVWWGAGRIESILGSICLYLGGYVLLVTVLFAALGRYRDQ